jgi:chromosome condensin MukBEF complex kleisin-like MukF subunit
MPELDPEPIYSNPLHDLNQRVMDMLTRKVQDLGAERDRWEAAYSKVFLALEKANARIAELEDPYPYILGPEDVMQLGDIIHMGDCVTEPVLGWAGHKVNELYTYQFGHTQVERRPE